jgi:hypothetical protein
LRLVASRHQRRSADNDAHRSKGEALREYKAEWDEDLRTFKRTPKHDWSSHAADAFRYLAMAWREPMAVEEKRDPIKELLKPLTLNDMCQMHVDDQTERGADPEQFITLND